MFNPSTLHIPLRTSISRIFPILPLSLPSSKTTLSPLARFKYRPPHTLQQLVSPPDGDLSQLQLGLIDRPIRVLAIADISLRRQRTQLPILSPGHSGRLELLDLDCAGLFRLSPVQGRPDPRCFVALPCGAASRLLLCKEGAPDDLLHGCRGNGQRAMGTKEKAPSCCSVQLFFSGSRETTDGATALRWGRKGRCARDPV